MSLVDRIRIRLRSENISAFADSCAAGGHVLVPWWPYEPQLTYWQALYVAHGVVCLVTWYHVTWWRVQGTR